MFKLMAVLLIAVSVIPAQEIQIGRPKLWLYDRLYPNLDGLLRDTEGISLSSLSNLDPNALNARIVDFVQSVIQASVSADQTAGVTNAAAQSLFSASRNLLNNQTAAAQSLSAEKLTLLQSLTQALDAQQKRIAALPQGTNCANDPQCQQLQQNVTDLNALWTSLQSASTAIGAPATLSPPNLTGVSAMPVNTPPALASIVDPKTFLSTALGSTGNSLPPREQMENFMTLLHERVTKQMALSLDEGGLSGEYVPLVAEFNVAIDPHSSRKEQKATSVFKLGVTGCPAGKEPIVYNLYPSLSAFNVADIQGKSSGFMLNGGIKGLFLGGTGSYQREHDRISQAMRQSVYMSGFRNGASEFGWVYRPPAYTNLIRPGVYSTFAVVLVPQGCGLTITGSSFWTTKKNAVKDRRNDTPLGSFSGFEVNAPLITQVQYDPHYASSDDLQNDVNIVTIEFEKPINPDLMITSSGKLLKRVRDWRGRATSSAAGEMISVSDSSGTTRQVSRARGLFEADIDEADTWIAVTQTKIMLKLKYATAGAILFPEIRLLTPGAQSWSLRDLVDFKTYRTKVTIGVRDFLACHPKANNADKQGNEGCMRQPDSMWLPLFVVLPSEGPGLRIVRTVGDAPDNSSMTGQVYFFLAADDGRTRLSPRAQVLMVTPGHRRFPHPIPIECSSLLSGLLCHTHPASVLYGTEPSGCFEKLPVRDERFSPVLRTSPECDINRYPLLRIELTQPGTKDTPTLFLTTVFPRDEKQMPVVGPATTLSRQGANARVMFPIYGLAIGTSALEVRSNGVAIAGANASVDADPSGSGLPVLVVDLPIGKALSPIHLYARNVDYGSLTGIQELLLPSNLELTIQNKIYVVSGKRLDNVDGFMIGEPGRAVTPLPFERSDSGLLVSVVETPRADSLMYYEIGGVRRPLVACFNRPKAEQEKDEDESLAKSKAKTQTTGAARAGESDKQTMEVTTATKVRTGNSQSKETTSDSAEKSGAASAKPAGAAQPARVCGPIIIAGAKPKDVRAATSAPAVATQGIPETPQPAPGQDAAKQIYRSPE